MGIPAGKLLTKIGYKKTALAGIATGFVGVLIQFLSGKFGADVSGFAVYLFGAFISGFAVCILNTVVNPMLNLLGGGGNSVIETSKLASGSGVPWRGIGASSR